MVWTVSTPCTAFLGTQRVASGRLADVALAVKAAVERDPAAAVLAFDDATGRVIDLDLRGSPAEILERLAEVPEKGARGRPRLGVVAREVTLLPRHWECLAAQPGGASPALRRLVEEASRDRSGESAARSVRERAHRFMWTMAGDLPGFEEAARALFAGDAERFLAYTGAWPIDIRDHARGLAEGAFA